VNLLVMAKEPVPGRVKTRLSPTFSSDQAATLAAAAISDTLRAAAGARRFDEVFLALDGQQGSWMAGRPTVLEQVAGGLADRLAGAWLSMSGPTLQIGMDTPQVTSGILDDAADELLASDVDAVLGLAADGGWWAIGLRVPADVFTGVAMSRSTTGEAQLERLRELGLEVRLLPVLRDVDRPDDAFAVAGSAPHTAFADAVRSA
jgi:uncharacterized protein